MPVFIQSEQPLLSLRIENIRMKNYNILITGAAGFIGANLSQAFLEKGARVVGLDNFSTGNPENMADFREHKNFQFIEGDIRDKELVGEIMQGIDVVFHQAALGSVPRSIKDPVTTIDVNITGTTNIFFQAARHKVPRVIYAASSSTYGDSKELPKIEHKIGKPLSPYAISKYVNEILADNFHKIYGLNTIGLRYFNVFGQKQDPQSTYAAVIPKFISLLMKHEAPVINGDGEFSRDFTYIKNVIQANELAAVTTNEEALNKVYNVAFGERTTLNELFGLIKNELVAFDEKIGDIVPVYGPIREGDIPHSLASIDLANRHLGYQPEYNVKKGLREAINWYWNNL